MIAIHASFVSIQVTVSLGIFRLSCKTIKRGAMPNAYNIDDLPLLLARSSKALAFAQLAISPHGLCRNNDYSTKLLRTYNFRNFYLLRSIISFNFCILRRVISLQYD